MFIYFFNQYHTILITVVLLSHTKNDLNSAICRNMDELRECSVQLLSGVRIFATSWTAGCQASRPSPTPKACSNSCPSSRWCHPTTSSSVIPFSHLQSFPASRSFPVSQFFTLGGLCLVKWVRQGKTNTVYHLHVESKK